MPHLLQCVVEALRFLEGAVWFQSCCTSFVVEGARHVESALVDKDDSWLIKPFDALAVLPEAILDALFLLVDVCAKAVLLASAGRRCRLEVQAS